MQISNHTLHNYNNSLDSENDVETRFVRLNN